MVEFKLIIYNFCFLYFEGHFKTLIGQKRDCRRNEKALCFSSFNEVFPLLFKQTAPHFHFALGPTNYVAAHDEY